MKTLEEILRERQQERDANLRNIMMSSQSRASTPEEQAGAGIGNLLGALAIKYFGSDATATDQELAKERARQGLFQGAQQNEMTPDGGMRSVPREMSTAEDLNYRADKFLQFYEKYGDTEAFNAGMKFKQLALDEAQSQRKAVGQLTPRQKWISNYVNSSQLPVTLEEANQEYDKLLLIGTPQGNQPTDVTQPVTTAKPATPVLSAADIGIVPPAATATPLPAQSTPIGADIVDEATVNSRVDQVLATMGYTRETAPANIIEALIRAEKANRPYK